MDTSTIITIIVMGIYTFVYVVVFRLQLSQLKVQKEKNDFLKTQIDSQKSAIENMQRVTDSMKTFMEIFKVDELKKFVDLKEENVKMDVARLIQDDKKFKEIATKVMHKEYKELHNNSVQELKSFAAFIIKSIPETDRFEFIEKHLPLNSKNIITAFKSAENETE